MFKGRLSSSATIDEAYEAFQAKPEVVLDNAKRIKEMALAIGEMMQTSGWLDYARPFIERMGNADRLLSCLGKDRPGEAFLVSGPEVLAYRKLLRFLDKLCEAGKKIMELEAQQADSERETDEDEGDEGAPLY